MQTGQASVTAQRVAAQRLAFDRVPARYGDPAADETLARDAGLSARRGQAARTARAASSAASR